jgi:hypothetical protein
MWLVLNLPFLLYLGQSLRWTKALPAAAIMFIDHLVCGLGIVKGLARWIHSR